MGLRVILDWVANHTAWDNVLVTEHPEWYARDWKGDFRPTPWWDWDDIIDLDYDQEGLRRYMTAAMCYWVQAADIDGFRCDVAGFVPLDFWENVRRELDKRLEFFVKDEISTFSRRQGDDAVLGAFNFTPREETVTVGDGPLIGPSTDALTGEEVTLEVGSALMLPAWGYRVLTT